MSTVRVDSDAASVAQLLDYGSGQAVGMGADIRGCESMLAEHLFDELCWQSTFLTNATERLQWPSARVRASEPCTHGEGQVCWAVAVLWQSRWPP